MPRKLSPFEKARREFVDATFAEWDALLAAARKVVASGVLCDPGCCGDDCGCEALRAAVAKKEL